MYWLTVQLTILFLYFAQYYGFVFIKHSQEEHFFCLFLLDFVNLSHITVWFSQSEVVLILVYFSHHQLCNKDHQRERNEIFCNATLGEDSLGRIFKPETLYVQYCITSRTTWLNPFPHNDTF